MLVDELYFANIPVTVAVNDGPDVTDVKTVLGAIRCESYYFVFPWHVLLHIAGHESRPVVACLNQPYGQHDLGSLGPFE